MDFFNAGHERSFQMPTYEYKCTDCGHEWEAEQRIVEDPLDTCPACNNKTARRLVSAGNFILKGGGWYADLYASPSAKRAADGAPHDSPGTGAAAAAPPASTPTSEAAPSKKPETPAPAAPAAGVTPASKPAAAPSVSKPT